MVNGPASEDSSLGPLFELLSSKIVGQTRESPDYLNGRPPTVVDLFCGSGGLTLGLINAGFECVGAYDNWSPAVATFRSNVCGTVGEFDLRYVPDIPHCDMIVGGPPCQGFSSAGRRNDSDERNTCVGMFAHLVASRRPAAFIFENVEGFLTAGGGSFVLDLLHPLVDAGYFIHLRKVNVANFGVPQHRKRVIAIGGLGFDPGFPRWTHYAPGAPGSHLAAQGLPITPSLAHAISDLPEPTTEPPGDFADHWYRPFSSEDLERVSLLGPGDRMKDLPERLWHTSYKRRAFRRVIDGTPTEKRGGAPAALRRLVAEQPSKAITSGSLRDFVHPNEHRPLTLRETARVQTYPDWFQFEGSSADRMNMIANSVPVVFAAELGRSVLNNLNQQQPDRATRGRLISFVPTLATGKSPALDRTCHLVRREFGVITCPPILNLS